jgi:sulfotransferase
MSQPKYHFISSLPRSDSTLLTAILTQNPRSADGISGPVVSFVTSLLAQISVGS